MPRFSQKLACYNTEQDSVLPAGVWNWSLCYDLWAQSASVYCRRSVSALRAYGQNRGGPLDTDQRECVACGFSEARPSDRVQTAATPVQDIPTRVSRPAARRVETPAEPVRLIDPAGGEDS